MVSEVPGGLRSIVKLITEEKTCTINIRNLTLTLTGLGRGGVPGYPLEVTSGCGSLQRTPVLGCEQKLH